MISADRYQYRRGAEVGILLIFDKDSQFKGGEKPNRLNLAKPLCASMLW
jgi:hypothetical protein